MKLSKYAKEVGVSYRTAWRWFKSGEISGYQLPSGTIIIDPKVKPTSHKKAAIYCRVSSAEMKDNLNRQVERLIQYAEAKGYQIYKVSKEIGSGLNDNRKNLIKLLEECPEYDVLIVEHSDRLTRFGANYIKVLFSQLGKKLEIVNNAENERDEIMQDLVSIIYSFSARIYGLRRAKRKTEKLVAELKSNETS